VRLVEQPEFGSTGDESGQGGATPLTSRQFRHPHIGQSAVESHASHRVASFVSRGARQPAPEFDVLGHGEIVIQTVGVADEPDVGPHPITIGCQINTTHDRRTAFERKESGAQSEQTRLPRTIGTTQQHDLAALDAQRDAGQRGERTDQRHRFDEVHHRCVGRRIRSGCGGRLLTGHTTRTLSARSSPEPDRYRRSPVITPDHRGATPRRHETPRDWYWFLGRLGQILIVTGVLLFLFVGYQLWGTGIEESQAQSRLRDRFEEATKIDPISDPSSTPTSSSNDIVSVEEGDPVAIIRIPDIGVEKYVVEGVEPDDLKKGPGHYPHSVQPGRLGNFAVAGHRTTYGEPFRNLDELVVGDDIEVIDARGREFVYVVTSISIVQPSDSWVVATSDPTVAVLTLTTCHPEFSAKQRLVVSARLDEQRTPSVEDDSFVIGSQSVPPTSVAPTTTAPSEASSDIVDDSSVIPTIETFDAGWFSDSSAWIDLAPWLVLEIGLVVALARFARPFPRRRRVAVGVVGLIPGLVVLYFVFQNVSRLLPPNL